MRGSHRQGGNSEQSCPLAVSVLFSSSFAADVIDVLQIPIDLIVKIDDCLGPRHFTSSAPAVQIARRYLLFQLLQPHALRCQSSFGNIGLVEVAKRPTTGNLPLATLASPRIATNRPIHGRRG